MKNKKDIIRVVALIVVLLMLLVIPLMMVGCAAGDPSEGENKPVTRAIIFLPDGEKIEGVIEGRYYSHSNTITVTIEGVEYVTHSSNVILISE